jgi:proteasome lid subunit RPN8/RPN11
MNKLSFEEFVQKVMGGESRYYPGEACGYVLIKEGGEEVFYSEWVYGDDVLDLIKL